MMKNASQTETFCNTFHARMMPTYHCTPFCRRKSFFQYRNDAESVVALEVSDGFTRLKNKAWLVEYVAYKIIEFT